MGFLTGGNATHISRLDLYTPEQQAQRLKMAEQYADAILDMTHVESVRFNSDGRVGFARVHCVADPSKLGKGLP